MAEELELAELGKDPEAGPVGSLWEAPMGREGEAEVGGKPDECLEVKVREVRKYVGWIDAEIERHEKPGQCKATPRQRVRRRILQRKFGYSRLTLQNLRQMKEKQRGVLRVKTMQLREKRGSKRRKW